MLVNHNLASGIGKHGVHIRSVKTFRRSTLATFHFRFGQFKRTEVTLLHGNVLTDLFHFRRIHKGTLHADGRITSKEEHVTLTHQLIGTLGVKNRARINLRHYLKCHTGGEVCLNRTRNDIRRGALRRNNHVHTYGTRQLRNTRNGEFDLLTCRHDKVTKFVNHHNDIRHVVMTMLGIELAGNEFGIIFLNVTHTRFLQKVVARIHFLTKTVEGLNHLRHVGNDGVAIARHLCQEVVFDGRIDREFHLLGVYHHDFEFCGVLLVKERSNNSIQTDGLTLTCGTRHKQVGHLCQVHHIHLIRNRLTQSNGEFEGRFLELLGIQDALHRHDERFLIRYFNTNRTLTRNRRNDTHTDG